MIIQRVLLVILFISAIMGLSGLGFWQLERAEEKRIRHENFLVQYGSAPLIGKDLSLNADLHWRKAVLSGSYEDTHVLLDNRTVMKRNGYEVFTPFKLSKNYAVLVNRGWVSNRSSRNYVPTLPIPENELEISGYFGPPPVVGVSFNDASSQEERLSAEVLRVQKIQIGSLGSMTTVELLPVIFYLEASQAGALKVERKLPGSGAVKHEAYATQWFCMAFVLGFIGFWNYFRRKKSE